MNATKLAEAFRVTAMISTQQLYEVLEKRRGETVERMKVQDDSLTRQAATIANLLKESNEDDRYIEELQRIADDFTSENIALNGVVGEQEVQIHKLKEGEVALRVNANFNRDLACGNALLVSDMEERIKVLNLALQTAQSALRRRDTDIQDKNNTIDLLRGSVQFHKCEGNGLRIDLEDAHCAMRTVEEANDILLKKVKDLRDEAYYGY